ncbi:hypothetical protein SDJN03_01899, partial [Cucurbita argyrosperma subsp. sororia]
MSPVLSEILRSGFTISSSLRRRTHLVQSFSVVFLHWFVISDWGSEPELWFGRGAEAIDGPEKKEENAIEPGIGAAVEDAETAALGRADGAAENSVLRAQILELTHRLDSLNRILSHINNNNDDKDEEQHIFLQNFDDYDYHYDYDFDFDFDFDHNPSFLNSFLSQQPPIVASADHHVLHC